MKKKVALHNLGCKVNAYETEAMAQLFEERGYEIVPFGEGADIYVINTCTVTNIADRKSRQMLHKAKKMNENAIVVAVGCYAQAFSEQLERDTLVDVIIGNDRKKNIVDIVEGSNKKSVIDINDTRLKHEFEELNVQSMEEHTRAYIKIQDGCNQFCTYCIIPYARGRVRSRNPENIMREVDRLIAKGYKEIVLTGIHLSSYGLDFKAGRAEQDRQTQGEQEQDRQAQEGLRLIDIVKMIGGKKEIKRIRLGSLEPRIITGELLEELKKIEAFCPHFHLSLQSGCDETLRRMNRRYTSQEYSDGCELIRKYYRDAAITTDVIVGFPGETQKEFEQCRQFLEAVDFAKMHIFKYSKRAGTKAAVMENQVDDNIKAQRSSALIELDEKLHRKYLEKFLGRCISVLFEEKIEIEGELYWTGYTMEYVRVAVRSEEELDNRIIEVKADRLLNNEIILAIF